MMNSFYKNTFFLYLLTFSNYLFSLITLPYETRVLGPDYFGMIGFATAFSMYFLIVLDFGFLLYGTKLVTQNLDNKIELSKIVLGITVAKLIIFLLLNIIVLFLLSTIEELEQYKVVLYLYLLSVGITSLMPDFFYRGIENMKIITIRTILVKFVFSCLIFVFLKTPEQYYLIPLFQLVGSVIALLWIVYDLYIKRGLVNVRVDIIYIMSLLKESFQYFISRIASTIYGATNTLILGLIYPTGETLGYFTSADRIRSIASQAASPIADSFYPYMLRTNDYKKMIKVTFFLESIIIICCVALWKYAEEFCVLIFGAEFRESGEIVKYMIPLLLLVLPNYIFGFPALSPIGMAKWANKSVVYAMFSQLLGILVLFLLKQVSVFSIIAVTILSESLCLVIRLIVFVKYKFSLKKEV